MLRATTTVLKGPDWCSLVVFGISAGEQFETELCTWRQPDQTVTTRKQKRALVKPASGPFAVIGGSIYFFS